MQNSQYWRIEKGKKKLYPHTAESSRRGGLTAQLLRYLLDRKEGWKGKGEIWKDSLSAFISFFSLNLKWFSFYTVLRGYCNFGLATLVDNLKATPQGHFPLSRLLCPWTFNTIHQLQNISASPGNSEVVPSLPLRFPVHISYRFVRRCIIIIWIYSLIYVTSNLIRRPTGIEQKCLLWTLEDEILVKYFLYLPHCQDNSYSIRETGNSKHCFVDLFNWNLYPYFSFTPWEKHVFS